MTEDINWRKAVGILFVYKQRGVCMGERGKGWAGVCVWGGGEGLCMWEFITNKIRQFWLGTKVAIVALSVIG